MATVRLVSVALAQARTPTVRLCGVSLDVPPPTSAATVRLVSASISATPPATGTVRLVSASMFAEVLPNSGRWRWTGTQWVPQIRHRNVPGSW